MKTQLIRLVLLLILASGLVLGKAPETVAAVEPRFPLFRWANGQPMFQLAPFVDVAHGWNKGDNRIAATAPITTFPDTLASIGVGLRWNILPDDRASFEVYWGQQLNHVPSVGNTIQDNGVHLGIVVNLF